MTDFDVIVIGSGVAGLSAAIAAADAGASVLIAEAATQVGGSSRLSGGHFYAAGTSLQETAGMHDSADAMFEHYMTLNQWLVDPANPLLQQFFDILPKSMKIDRAFAANPFDLAFQLFAIF